MTCRCNYSAYAAVHGRYYHDKRCPEFVDDRPYRLKPSEEAVFFKVTKRRAVHQGELRPVLNKAAP
jgi:hypothetical protein